MDNSFLLAFGLTLFAGLATGIGSAIAFFAKRSDYRFLSVATGFSAGVMLYISFVELLPQAADILLKCTNGIGAAWRTATALFGGLLLMLVIDRTIPTAENPHEVRSGRELDAVHAGVAVADMPRPIPVNLRRLGIFTALAIAIHNFPEGLATFVATRQDLRLGIAIGLAIALHNIPEGISVSVPIYYATGSRRRAFLYSLVSGLAEPAGALIGYAIQRPFLCPGVMGALFGIVAGIMIYISLDELLPTARAYGKGHEAMYGLLLGMATIALSLLLTG